MTLARRLRAVSEEQLMVAAQREIAERYGSPPPSRPRGVNRFWQGVYVPAYHRLPWWLRSRVMRAMPGSHRRTWHAPRAREGPGRLTAHTPQEKSQRYPPSPRRTT